MRHLRYLPFTYLAGIHGFIIFAPYLLVCGVVLLIAYKFKRGVVVDSPGAVAVPVNA